MKIGLITIHRTTNYGGVFQALATQEFLKNYGEVVVIDYRNSYVDKTMQPIRFGFRPRDFLRIAKDVFRFSSRKKAISKFSQFINSYLNLSGKVKLYSELDECSGNFDVVVSGSDQLWNPKVVSEDCYPDLHYFLNFAGGCKKISYASSLGDYPILNNSKFVEMYHEELSQFSFLSVREESSVEILKKICDIPVDVVVDPTLLLSKEQWVDTLKLKKEGGGEYIFVYALKKDELLKSAINKIVDETGLPVWVVDQDPFLGFKADRHFKCASPEEFLELLISAKIVISNSYHGCVFSVNFGKSFLPVLPPSAPNRVIDFLKSLGLDGNVYRDENVRPMVCESWSEQRVNAENLLASKRERSIWYLDKAFGRDG